MKIILIATMIILTSCIGKKEEGTGQIKKKNSNSSTLSVENEQKNGGAANNKQKILSGIEERISLLENHKKCVQEATEHEQFKNCDQAMKNIRKELHGKMMEKYKGKKKKTKKKKNDTEDQPSQK